MSDILQRLVTGTLTNDEKRGVSDFNKKWDRNDPEPLEPISVSFMLQDEQKVAVYQDVKQRVNKGATPDDIAAAVVAAMDEHLLEKQKQAYPGAYGEEQEFKNKRTGNKGSFKRV